MDEENTSKQIQQYSSCDKNKGEIIFGQVPEGLCQSLFHILGTFHGVHMFAISTGVPCGTSEGTWTAGGGVWTSRRSTS